MGEEDGGFTTGAAALALLMAPVTSHKLATATMAVRRAQTHRFSIRLEKGKLFIAQFNTTIFGPCLIPMPHVGRTFFTQAHDIELCGGNTLQLH